ncbi:unnamed protein product, partial [Ceratitis capitata]
YACIAVCLRITAIEQQPSSYHITPDSIESPAIRCIVVSIIVAVVDFFFQPNAIDIISSSL